MIQYTTEKVIRVQDWNKLVQDTYGKPYNYQQQEGCQDRGTFNITIPSEWDDDGMNDSIPEVVNGSEMGVKFSVWLTRDPKEELKDEREDGKLE